MYLPLVNPEVANSVQQRWTGQDDEQLLKMGYQRLTAENPAIAFFVSQLAEKYEDPMPIELACMAVYDLLRSQAEANAMTKELAL